MKAAARVICLLLSVLILAGCAPQGENIPETTAPESSGALVDIEETQPAQATKTLAALESIRQLGESPDDNYRTFYEVFVYSFCDSDGDGIGDFNGLTSKLDYLQDLGIQGIWLMPIHPSTSYHKYNVSDYYAIDPQYGTMADFENFMAECEKRDIHVIIDLVLNHSGSEHIWFKTAVEYLRNLGEGEPNVADCPYLDYYFFSKEPATGYCEVTGTDWYYEGRFNYDMPDLNLDCEALWGEIEDIMAFWFDKGVAGFRLDAAKEFVSGSVSRNVEILSRMQQTAVSLKPDAYLVAEVWESFNQIARYYESGITSLFNFAFGNSDGKITTVIRNAGNPATVTTYATALEKADKAYLASNPDYIDAPFLSNHDVGRIAGFANRDPLRMKLAGAMNIFMGGSCFIYYGEEIGMPGAGHDPSKRAPMYWNAARANGTTNPPPECQLPGEYALGSLEEQVNDDASLYNYYCQAIAIRNALPVIARGRVVAETGLNVECISAQRKTWGDEECIILMNISPDAGKCDLTGYEDWTVVATLSADGNQITRDGSVLNMPAYAVAVLVPNF